MYAQIGMDIDFDPAKDIRNRGKHGLSLRAAEDMDWENAMYWVDDRWDYGEKRIMALGHLHERLHVAIYTERNGLRRMISLRKANPKEVKRYEGR